MGAGLSFERQVGQFPKGLGLAGVGAANLMAKGGNRRPNLGSSAGNTGYGVEFSPIKEVFASRKSAFEKALEASTKVDGYSREYTKTLTVNNKSVMVMLQEILQAAKRVFAEASSLSHG